MRADTQILRRIGILMLISGALTTAHGVPETTVNFSIDDVDFSQMDGYDVLNVAGCHLAGEPGQPLLPCKAVNFVIPRGQGVSQVRVEVESQKHVPGSYYIYPAQPTKPTGDGFGNDDFVGPDVGIYGSDEPFPGAFLVEGETSMAWGWKIYQVMVWPLEYLPADREVWLYETVKVWLELAPSTENEQELMPRSKEHHEEWAAELEQAMANPEDVQPLAPNLFSGLLTSRRWVLILPARATDGREQWYDAFHGLILHRQNQGLDVEVIYLDQITQQSGEDAVLAIRSYLYDQQANHGARWACLVGDHEMIPWTYRAPRPTYPYDFGVPNDWCYCDLDGSWPDGYDWSPELWVGRVPAPSSDEGGHFVDKVLTYEANPGGGDLSYLSRAFYEEADQGQDLGTCSWLNAKQDTSLSWELYSEIPSHDADYPTFPEDEDVVAILSPTPFNYVTVHCHGFTDLFWPLSHGNGDSAVSGTSFGLDDVESLSNTDCYSFWYSISCYNGRLDDTLGTRSISEATTCMYVDRGAVAFCGNSRPGVWLESYFLQSKAWEVLFPKGLIPQFFNHAGSVEVRSKLLASLTSFNYNYHLYVRYSHNLFGDPATPIWTPQYTPSARKQNSCGAPQAQDALCWALVLPNPVVNSDITIRFDMDRCSRVRIRAYDITGRLVKVFLDKRLEPGVQEVVSDISMLPPGAYVIRAETSRNRIQRRITVLR